MKMCDEQPDVDDDQYDLECPARMVSLESNNYNVN